MITKQSFLVSALLVMLASGCRPQTPNTNRINSGHKPDDASELFKVTRDTIHVDIEGRLYSALLIHDKYYSIYEVRDSMSTQPIRKFYILKKNGQIEKEIKLSKGLLQDTYPQLYYYRNHIIVNTTFYKGTYVLSEDKGRFEQIPEIVDVPLFEDEKTKVTSECHGEFGSTIYFENKSTGTIYSSHAGCPLIVNKAGNEYFLNVSGGFVGGIVEIQDPIVSNTTAAPTEKIIYHDDGLASNFYIPTSFLMDSKLYLLYNFSHDERGLFEKKERIIVTNDSVQIGTVQKGVFKAVYSFKDRIHIEFEQHLEPDYQICIFHTEVRVQIGFKADNPPYMEGKYGVIEIQGNEIKIHYFISDRQTSGQ